MKANFRRLLSCVLAVLMVVASFTFTAAAASYADVSTVSSATISEINTGNPLDYEVGEDIVAQFQIKSGSTVLTAPSVHYSAVMDDGRTLTGNVSPVDGVYTITLKGGLRRPGFVLMTVSACDANGNKYTKNTTPKIEPYGFGAGADIDKIQSIYGVPDEYSDFGEFNAFWDETLAQLDAEGGEATLDYICYCGEYTFSGVKYDCYELEINCPKDDNYKDTWGGDNHVAAYLTIPHGKTDLKAQFLYKGYDWISASGSHTSIEPQSSICNPNYITISVSPHSIPAPHNVAEADASSTWVSDGAYIGDYYKNSSGGYLYDTYKYTNNHGKNETENASPYTTYFKYMLMRDVQAVNFLKLYFNDTGVSGTVNGVDTSVFAGVWDGANILTSGSSQGGYQALAVAGLDSDVNSVSAGVPWFADQGVTSADSDRYKPTSPRNFPYGEGLRYVDTANLATRISKDCSVTINAGLKDSLVPPSTVMSIYDLLNCNVTLKFNQNMGHGGSGQYSQSISKTVDTSEKSHTINYVSDFDASFKADFEAAWEKVCDTNVVSVDLYKVDKSTDIDFKALAASSTADGIGIVLTGEGLTNINAKLAEIYALHNDVNSKVWVIENNNALDGKNAAITFDACMNWGDRPTADGSIKLYTEDGELGQTSVLGANVPYAVIATPLWVSAQGILVDAENVTLKDGMLSTSVDEASVTFSAPAYSASYNMTGVGDAADYGNIEGIGLWVVGNDGTLTIKGAGAIPTYDSYADAPWAENTITNVVVSDGITSIGANSLAISGVTVNLPLSVAAIEVGAVSADATIVSYDNAYAKTFAKENSIKFTNLGATGSAGTDLTWLLDIDSGVLTIEGTGTKTYSGSGGWSSDGSKEKLSVFYPYKDQIKTIKFGDSVTNIGSKTFYYIGGLTTVELTPNIKTIENNAFGNCANLSTIYVKGNEPVTGTYDLTYVTSMTGGYQFDGSGKTTLKEVKLSDNLTGGLGDKFISYNSSLKSITIPAGVTSFSYRTFNQCTALKEVTFLGNPTIPNNFLLNADEQVDKNNISKGYKTYIDTIYAKEGTSIQTWVDTANAKYEEIGVTHRVTFSALEEEPVARGKAGENLTWKIMNENGEYVMYIQGTGNTIRGYNTETGAFETAQGYGGPAVAKFDWAPYATSIKKMVIEAPVTAIYGYNLANFDNCHTVELPTSMTAIKNDSCFNDMDRLATVYTTGQTPEVGTANLSNITSIAGYAFVKSSIKKIIFAEGVKINGNAFVWNTKLESVEIPNGATVATTAFRGYPSNSSLTSVTYADEFATVMYTPFVPFSDGTVNNYITTITVNNPSATFEGCTTSDYSAFLNAMGALTTVKGYSDSTAEAMVEWANANGREIEFVSLGGANVASGSYSGATWTLTTGEDGKYVITIGGDVTSLPAASSDWGLDSYKADVTKVVIEAPITSLNATVKDMFANALILELPTSCKSIGGSALNDARKLHTVYTTGQEMVEGTFNLSNITSVASYALVRNMMDTIIVGENCNFSSNALFWQGNLSKVIISEGAKIGKMSFVSGTSNYASDDRVWEKASVEFPASMSVIPAESFYGNNGTSDGSKFPNNVVVEITVKNPDALFAIATNATANDYEGFVTWMSALKTVKGSVGSTAETFVNWANEYFTENAIDRTITFEEIGTVASGMPIGDDLYFRILDDGNGKYIFDIYGTGTTAQAMSTSGEYLAGGYANFVGNNKYKETNYYQYCGKVSKIKFSAPNLTKISGYLFQAMGAQILELHPNMTNINNDAFNGLTTLTTVYTTGQTPEIGVANLTNVPTIGGYVFYQNKFVKILLNENLTSIGTYTFGNATKLEMIEIPAKVTSIGANAFINASNLKYISFGADSFTYSSSSFSGICADVTIAGKTGSTAETLAEEKGVQFIDSAYINEIVAVYSNGNSVILLDKVDDKNVTAYATGSATYFNMGYTNYDTAVNQNKNGHLRVWDKYKSLITKAIYVNPGFTKIDSSFATHANLKTVEIPASVTAITDSGFNGSGLTTLYITGNAVKEGVIDLSNITSLGSMCMASAKAHTILLNDNLSGTWGQNLFFQCKSLLYIRVPVGVTSFTGMVFNGSSKLNTVLFENKNTTISSDAFSGCTGLKTIIGYRGSTAETYANANGLEFIPLETESLLTFEGYEIREKDYNGLRSIFTANPAAMAALEAKGLKVVEYGSLLASTDKLNDAGVELTIAKNADGEYASHGFAVVSPIYQKGFRVGKILSESETAIEYACTVTYFNESNYTKNVTFRGYIVYEDKEGNDYVVYADLIGDDGEIYNSTNLEFVCQGMIDDGRDLSANISWLDVLKFRENLVK